VQFVFISGLTFEPWSWDSPYTTGIGGSETSHIEMAERLAARGHRVISYAPVPWEADNKWHAGVDWHPISELTGCLPLRSAMPDTVYVLYRDPRVIDILPSDTVIWLICQDVDYPTLTAERAARCTRIVALCQEHANYLRRTHPTAADKVCVSSNGIRDYRLPNHVRNPHRLMYASSPDRGLWILLYIFERVKEVVPDAELHVFYGFQNLKKVLEVQPEAECGVHMQEISQLLETPGVTHHGRVPQQELAVEWLKSAVWCFPTGFPETSCITCMDAQALGAIPVTNPLWALEDNVQHGVMVHGDPYTDVLCRSRYVHEIVRLLLDEERQASIRAEMMPWAQQKFDWENVVEQWLSWTDEDTNNGQICVDASNVANQVQAALAQNLQEYLASAKGAD
jgi:glycosyltransferase involved in cell wall biosynthesis